MAIVRLAYKLNSGVNILDLALGMSLTERRLIHQKQVFTIMGGMISDGGFTPDGDMPIKISTAPNNFYTRNAVTRGFRTWKAMRKKALEADSSVTTPAKYSDFKVHLDATGTVNYLRPVDAGGNVIAKGEWDYADLTADDPNVPTTELMIVGPHDPGNARYSLAKGWLQTRPAPQVQQPNMPDIDGNGNEDVNDDFLVNLFQDTTETTLRMDDIVDQNDFTPFARLELMTTDAAHSNNEPNNLQLQFFVDPQNDDLHCAVPGFQALCGLVRVDVGEDYTNPILVLDVDTKGWNF